MSPTEHSDAESSRQEQFDILLKLIVTLTENRQPTAAPAIVPGCLYTRGQVESYLGIGDGTTTIWIDFFDLQPIQPGTAKQYFLGSEVIDFMVKNRNGIIKPKTSKAKADARKAQAAKAK